MEYIYFFFALVFLLVPVHSSGTVENLEAETSENILTSPNFPYVYPENANCTWIITAEESSECVCVEFDFLYIDKTVGEDCCPTDYVSFQEGEFVTEENDQKFCGDRFCKGFQEGYNPFIGEICSTNTNTITMNFISDGTIQLPGFQLRYYSKLFRSR